MVEEAVLDDIGSFWASGGRDIVLMGDLNMNEEEIAEHADKGS